MSVSRATQQTITFVVIDPSNRPAAKTGLTFSSGNSKIIKDGGAAANTANLPAEVSASGRYALTLTAAEMDAAHITVFGQPTGGDPFTLMFATDNHPSAQAQTSSTTTSIISNRTETTDNQWKNCWLKFTSGALAGAVQQITAYTGSTKTFTTNAFAAAPSNGDYFVIIDK